MSSVSPRVRTPDQPGEYVGGNITRWIGFSSSGEGKIHDIVSCLKKRGGEFKIL